MKRGGEVDNLVILEISIVHKEIKTVSSITFQKIKA